MSRRAFLSKSTAALAAGTLNPKALATATTQAARKGIVVVLPSYIHHFIDSLKFIDEYQKELFGSGDYPIDDDTIIDLIWPAEECDELSVFGNTAEILKEALEYKAEELSDIDSVITSDILNGNAYKIRKRFLARATEIFRRQDTSKLTDMAEAKVCIYGEGEPEFVGYTHRTDKYEAEDQIRFAIELQYMWERGFRSRMHKLPSEMADILDDMESHPLVRLMLMDHYDRTMEDDDLDTLDEKDFLKRTYGHTKSLFKPLSDEEVESLWSLKNKLGAISQKLGGFVDKIPWNDIKDIKDPKELEEFLEQKMVFKISTPDLPDNEPTEQISYTMVSCYGLAGRDYIDVSKTIRKHFSRAVSVIPSKENALIAMGAGATEKDWNTLLEWEHAPDQLNADLTS